ncbi:MAG: hypothetical protein ABF459_04325 [Gluconobacter cerinus]
MNAPSFVWSFGILADPGPWYGGLQGRWLKGYPLACAPQERSLNTGSRVPKNLKLGANVFNAHA